MSSCAKSDCEDTLQYPLCMCDSMTSVLIAIFVATALEVFEFLQLFMFPLLCQLSTGSGEEGPV